LANIFRSNGFRGAARQPLHASARRNATAQLAASAATRLNAAKAELEGARSESMSASLACKVAEGQKNAAERHGLRLAHRAAKERLERAQASADRCQSKFDAAFRDFQNAA